MTRYLAGPLVMALALALTACVDSKEPLLPVKGTSGALAGRYTYLNSDGETGTTVVNWIDGEYRTEDSTFTTHAFGDHYLVQSKGGSPENPRYEYALLVSGKSMVFLVALACNTQIVKELGLTGVAADDEDCRLTRLDQLLKLAEWNAAQPLDKAPAVSAYVKVK